MNIVFGAGGVARECAWMLSDISAEDNFVLDMFVINDSDWQPNRQIDDIYLINESDFFARHLEISFNAYVAIGLPSIRHSLVSKIRRHTHCQFPNIIHPRATMDRRKDKTTLGQGVVIYPGASLTTEVTIGDFVHINPCVTVGHSALIGNYCTLCPGANVSGNSRIGSGCFIGAGAVVKEGVRIPENCMIGAGAVVVKSITQSGTWVGIPARRIQK